MNSSRSFQNITLVLIIIGIMALALSGYLTPLSRYALAPFIGAQTWISNRFQAIQSFINTPRDVTLLTQENQTLKAENSRLQAQIIQLQQDNAELQVLSALLDFARAHPENEYMSSAVIGRDPSPFLHYVFINRGSDDGLRRGMPVVTEQGLVGRVAAVTAGAARVQLITDPGISINVKLKNAGADAVLTGSITGEITLNQISQDSTVNEGDVVLTSGLGGEFPADIPVGQVSAVRQRPYDLFQTASVQPVTDFSQLEILLVITNFRPVNVAPLVP